MSDSAPSREHLLELAFSDLPNRVGASTIRPMSAGSFVLLQRLGNSLVAADSGSPNDPTKAFSSVIEYIWLHSAPLDVVAAIEGRDDLPMAEIKRLGFDLSMTEVGRFLAAYQKSAMRMSAALAEAEETEGDEGKPGVPFPAGSPPLSSSAEEPVTLSGNVTSSGSCPSREPLPISMPETSATELPAGGSSMILEPLPTRP